MVDQPWQGVPPSVAKSLRPALPGVVDEVIAAVQEAVPVYSGGLDPTVRNGVHVALDGFLELVEGGEPSGVHGHCFLHRGDHLVDDTGQRRAKRFRNRRRHALPRLIDHPRFVQSLK